MNELEKYLDKNYRHDDKVLRDTEKKYKNPVQGDYTNAPKAEEKTFRKEEKVELKHVEYANPEKKDGAYFGDIKISAAELKKRIQEEKMKANRQKQLQEAAANKGKKKKNNKPHIDHAHGHVKVNPEWNPEEMAQYIIRCLRSGERFEVNVFNSKHICRKEDFSVPYTTSVKKRLEEWDKDHKYEITVKVSKGTGLRGIYCKNLHYVKPAKVEEPVAEKVEG